jgi:hypothetical protein
MTTEKFNGSEIASIVTEAQGVNEYNSVRYYINGEEILPSNLLMVVYNDDQEETECDEGIVTQEKLLTLTTEQIIAFAEQNGLVALKKNALLYGCDGSVVEELLRHATFLKDYIYVSAKDDVKVYFAKKSEIMGIFSQDEINKIGLMTEIRYSSLPNNFSAQLLGKYQEFFPKKYYKVFKDICDEEYADFYHESVSMPILKHFGLEDLKWVYVDAIEYVISNIPVEQPLIIELRNFLNKAV